MSGECDNCGEHALECFCNETLVGSVRSFWGPHNLMVTAAHRYCLGRRTYIVSVCVNWLKSNWDKFDKNTKKMIVEETQEALERDLAGDSCDIREWEQIINLSY
jgi:hypothetical protein